MYVPFVRGRAKRRGLLVLDTFSAINNRVEALSC